MARLADDEDHLLRSLSELSYCNPFEPVRIDAERAVLRDAHQPEALDSWSRTADGARTERPNIVAINELAAGLVERLYERQQVEGSLEGDEATLYDDLVTYTLYYRHVATLEAELVYPAAGDARIKRVWREYRKERERLLAPLADNERSRLSTSEHLFACLHQVRRAFDGIYHCLIGESAPATRLRAAVWQSIFTHDLRRYRRSLFGRMRELATLVTGPSGAGKELVAQAIGRSQYRPFDPEAESFVGEGDAFIALNLSALSPTLVESELFGHRKGAFTGATSDRVGWLERCPPHGAVFLDEIGDVDPSIQVKLLRVAQSRDYSRLGESESRSFAAKLVAATNRDLAAEMRAGRFREDLYYRLCSDQVVVPSLGEQLADQPAAIAGLVRFLVGRVLRDSEPAEAEALAEEVGDWITGRMPPSYEWPGNIRELEQCVRSVLVRREYHPTEVGAARTKRPTWLDDAERGQLSADELLNAYCRQVYGQQGGYEPAARVLGLDRRTVKSRVDSSD
ncbi:Transcriptional regulatory protein ZraR [Botrimarina colliarenosi]|uniref:Transcriptional regulatory protein ZraR n=1 Tax=Botrimarina colliarenosi TaxID=2528001 RepID=A0A5C6AFZ0_9BACT|nr:sigma 54-interacting transcriptional regulator [Botrimarina colliarenosi]TWT97981.1 Transcriptional regulatory protein ZraR [Botrimarina colliarenosi]